MCWQPIFILLIIISTCTDYFIGKQLSITEDSAKRKLLLYGSLLINIGVLFYFKYFNFLSENIELLFSSIGMAIDLPEHSYMLPVGISFYTFQTLSYTIDLYRKNEKVEHNFIDFSLYVSFFPQLVAGPIERSKNILPQLKILHQFDYSRFRIGGILILIGLFKKLVIADRFAIYVDEIFLSPETYNGISVVLGAIFFSFQIYGDFSGYTDIAIGSAWILGIKLMQNFKGPYLSSSFREFWQRWHISLSTWFRDYVYIPLGGNRNGNKTLYRNLVIVFLLTAIWHGANWTYVVWGMIHGVFLILERVGMLNFLDRISKILKVLVCYVIVCLAWIFFRAESVSDAWTLVFNIFVIDPNNLFPVNIYENIIDSIELYISLFFLLVIACFHYFEFRYDSIHKISESHVVLRWALYIFCIVSISFFGEYGSYKEFIYFQF